MKANKWILKVTIIISVISLSLYFYFQYGFNTPIDVGKDIMMALFGSSILLVLTALIGYLVEKAKVLGDILGYSRFSLGVFLLQEMNSKNFIDRQELARMISASKTELLKLRKKSLEYCEGCMLRFSRTNKDLKEFIKIKAHSYYEEIVKLNVYIGSPDPNWEIVTNKFLELSKRGLDLEEELCDWLEISGAKIGKGLDIDDNFVSEYETKARSTK